MNKHDKEVAAAQKRVEAGKEYERKRKELAKDAYRCYLAYMRLRKLI